MTFLLLNLITASRLVFCAPIWLWCWWKRPRGMTLWMCLDFLYFLVTDHLDGAWAREYGLVSELGYWLDHLGDFVFYGSMVLTILKGSREPEARRKKPSEVLRTAGTAAARVGPAPAASPATPDASAPTQRPPSDPPPQA